MAYSYLVSRRMLHLTLVVAVCTVAAALIGSGVESKAAGPANIKVLVVLVTFTDNPTKPVTLAQVQNQFFGPSNSVDSFYRAASNNRISFSGDVIGWYTVTRTKFACIESYGEWRQKAFNAILDAGVDVSKYSIIQYIYGPTCSGGTGYGYYGSPGVYPPPLGYAYGPAGNKSFAGVESFILGLFYYSLYAHEIGHNLGGAHSSTIGNEYGDISDVMGNTFAMSGYQPLMPNAPHMFNYAWTEPSGVQNVGAGGTYTIKSVESHAGLRTLKISRTDLDLTYYISMREAIGIDATMGWTYLNGANIHRWSGVYYVPSQFLTRLDDGVTFTDSFNGITIKQLSHTANTATVQVTASTTACIRKNHVLYQNRTPAINGGAGETTNISLTLTNNDTTGCAPNTYTFNSTLPPGWSGSFTPQTLTLAAGTQDTVVLPVTPPADAAPGAYGVYYDVVRDYDQLKYGYISNFVLYAPTCVPAAPTVLATPNNQTGSPGTARPYTLTITNNDSSPCSSTSFAINLQPPMGWTHTVSSPIVVLNPGASITVIASTTPGLGTSPATVTIPIQITDASVSGHNGGGTVQYTVTIPPCLRAAPTVTPTPQTYTDAIAGDTKEYTVTIRNNDSSGCSASNFAVTPQAPPGWTTTQPPPTTGLVGHWTFDQGSGSSAADSSGSGNTGTLAGSPNNPAWIAGKIGGALNFDGINDYVTVPDASALDVSTAMSISAWIKTSSTAATPREIVRKATGGYGWFFLLHSTGKVALSPSGLSAEFNNGFTYNSDDQWHMVTATFNGSTITMYRDGVQQMTYPASGALTVNNDPMVIGSLAGTSQFFPGGIDDVRVYNRDLSAAEVAQLYGATGASILLAPGATGSVTVEVTSPTDQPIGTTNIPLVVSGAIIPTHQVTVNVGYEIPNSCVRAQPTLMISPSSRTTNAGEQASYSVSIKNEDSAACSASTFTFSSSVPGGWGKNVSPALLPLDPQVTGLATFSVTADSGAALGSYPVSVSVSESGIPEHSGGPEAATYTVGIVPPPPIPNSAMNISATRVQKGKSTQLRWWISSGLTDGMHCDVSPANKIQSGGPTSFDVEGGITSWGSASSPIVAQTVEILEPTIFTLSCTDGTTASTKYGTVNFLPQPKEI